VRIIDSETKADITSKVLMQIILEFDPPKVDLFTAPLLAEMIRVKDQVMKGFFEKFFTQALASFLAFHRAMEAQIQEGTLLPSLFPNLFPWTAPSSQTARAQGQPPAGPSQPKDPAGLGEVVQQLQQEMAALRREVGRSKRPKKPKRKGKGK
jgi:hypothetical protein